MPWAVRVLGAWFEVCRVSHAYKSVSHNDDYEATVCNPNQLPQDVEVDERAPPKLTRTRITVCRLCALCPVRVLSDPPRATRHTSTHEITQTNHVRRDTPQLGEYCVTPPKPSRQLRDTHTVRISKR